MPYSPLLIKPFREEVVSVGVQELQTAQDVENFMKNLKGISIVFFNSVCACAAGIARPAIQQLMSGDKKPDRIVSVFAGQDLEATAKMRSYIADIPPSSPSIAIFKDEDLVYFMPKHRMEGRDKVAVASDLMACMDEFVGV